jgi:hypothetical protein
MTGFIGFKIGAKLTQLNCIEKEQQLRHDMISQFDKSHAERVRSPPVNQKDLDAAYKEWCERPYA